MRPDEREIDDEIRGHIALAIKDRVDRGEDPEAARRAAYAEFGYLPAAREEMRRVWYGRWFDAVMDFARDVKVGARSLGRSKGLALTVVITLALGIGANAAIFSVVRGVLLAPLVNRDQDRLLYIRQSSPAVGSENLTFSVPEIADLKARVRSVQAFGDFSTIEYPMVGAGEPRVVRAGVVSGTFFEVMGLEPVLGRLLTPADDGPAAASAVVLTHRFWTTAFASDPNVVGRTVRFGSRTSAIVGVLEPSVPYPADTEIIANIVTSPHHLDATMVTGRTHRMTELFARLAPGVTVAEARAEIEVAHAALVREHPDSYGGRTDVMVTVRQLRDQIASPARAILLVLLVTTAIVFIVACANVANLLLARSVRRESELAVRAALGASRGALRRTLLAESTVLCGAGAALGLLLAGPLVDVIAQLAARFSVRAVGLSLDAAVAWAGVGLAMSAAVALAYLPRVPGHDGSPVSGASACGVRITPSTNRRLKSFAVAQIACSFVLLAAAGTLVATLVALRSRPSPLDLERVVALDVPLPLEDFGAKTLAFYGEATRRLSALPGVDGVAIGNVVPWRDRGSFGPFPFAAEGYTPANGEGEPQAHLRNVSTGYFATMGLRVIAGREFTDADPAKGDPVAIVSESLAARIFPGGEVLNRRVWWSDPMFGKAKLRIVGIVADMHDEQAGIAPAFTLYHPLRQMPFGGRLFVRTAGDPYALVPAITRVIREIAPDQPVERAATLADIRKELAAPDRINAFVVGGFASVAFLIALVGIAGVLAFTVSARTREFGVRLAVGSSPWGVVVSVVREGLAIVGVGIGLGALAGAAVVRAATGVLDGVPLPTAGQWLAAGVVLAIASVGAALLPALRASRVDVLKALRTE